MGRHAGGNVGSGDQQRPCTVVFCSVRKLHGVPTFWSLHALTARSGGPIPNPGGPGGPGGRIGGDGIASGRL
ncbi:MAG: hypothetical protein ACOY3Y_04170, partial [Acidobacteriota bacterium]